CVASPRGNLYFQAEDGIRDRNVTGVQTCALPISAVRTKVSSRLPNSTAWCSAGAAPGTGTRLSSLHRGHVSQPSPEAVTRTVTRSAERRVGKQRMSSRLPCSFQQDEVTSDEQQTR